MVCCCERNNLKTFCRDFVYLLLKIKTLGKIYPLEATSPLLKELLALIRIRAN